MKERTLVNIKPDAVGKSVAGEIIRRIEEAGFRIIGMKRVQLSRTDAEAFYEVHRGKPFFEGLVAFMCSGPCIPMVVEGEGAVQGIRTLVGATDPAAAGEGTIRRDLAEDVRRNAVHASDAPETAAVEIAFFFAQRELI